MNDNDTNRSQKQNLEQPRSGVFRSEEMVLCQLFLQSNVAFEATCTLGELGIIEFRDLNIGINVYQRKYVDEIKHIGEIQRKLIYLHQQLFKENIPIVDPEEPVSLRYKEIIAIENRIEEFDNELRAINEHLHSLLLEEFELIEMSKILSKTNELLETSRRQRQTSFNEIADFSTYTHNSNNVGDLDQNIVGSQNAVQKSRSNTVFECNKIYTITGLIRTEKALAFRKIIWRLYGQNALVQFYDLETPIDDVRVNEFVEKKVFLIMCQGEHLYSKITKICNSFHASQYPLPEHEEQYRNMCLKVEKYLHDIKLVVEQTQKQKFKTLMEMAKKENFSTWVIQITKLCAIFTTLNMFQKTEKGFLAEGWCARTDQYLLYNAIQKINDTAGFQGQACVENVYTTNTPPTYFRLNRFTKSFQNIVNSYGVASYREMNPAPYTIITFPFLFAMMFADAGHGFIMMLFSLWMILYERRLQGKSNNEIWLTFFEGRYIILLMGAFSIYTGIIYNDIFSKACNLFGTSFHYHSSLVRAGNYNESIFDKNLKIYLDKGEWNYPYGIDPAWQISENKILFLNSFKMKLSVIIGVLQMFFGLMISLMNHINHRSWDSILFEFIPRVIFLLSLFGYMIVLIFAKWLLKWEPYLAPSILIDFINMFLMKYPNGIEDPPYLRPWFSNKQAIQIFLLILALLQIPIMLLVKPIIKVCQRKLDSQPPGPSSAESQSNSNQQHHEESISDIFIHQAIHTIEYCLGSVSHTASYLRLWALSLAHSQLSEILWSMVMCIGYASNSSNLILRVSLTYVTFGFWAILTVAILVVMEGLSAFLHALRLHWVEFQSKFYDGSGYMFRPFNLKTIMLETNILVE